MFLHFLKTLFVGNYCRIMPIFLRSPYSLHTFAFSCHFLHVQFSPNLVFDFPFLFFPFLEKMFPSCSSKLKREPHRHLSSLFHPIKCITTVAILTITPNITSNIRSLKRRPISKIPSVEHFASSFFQHCSFISLTSSYSSKVISFTRSFINEI